MDKNNNKTFINNIINKKFDDSNAQFETLIAEKTKAKLDEKKKIIAGDLLLFEQGKYQYDMKHQYISKMLYKIRKLLIMHKNKIRQIAVGHQDLQQAHDNLKDLHDKGVG